MYTNESRCLINCQQEQPDPKQNIMDDNLAVSDAMQVCDQCKRDVAEANFQLHVSHCRRFLSLCPDCDEPVPRELLEQHKLDQHLQVACSKCYKKIERCHLQDHDEEECVERVVRCEFCELEVPWRGLADHAGPCGSRTERCRDCGRYVTLRNQHQHTCAAASGLEPSRPEILGPEPTRPAPTRPERTRPAPTRLAPTRPERTSPEQTGPERTRIAPTSPERTRPEQTGPERTRPEQTGPERTRPEQTGPERTRPEPTGPDRTGPEPSRPGYRALLEYHNNAWLQNHEKEEEEEEEEEDEEEEDYPWFSDPRGLGRALKAFTSVGRGWEASGGCGGRDGDQLSTCPHCHLTLPLRTLRWHQRKCQIHVNLK